MNCFVCNSRAGVSLRNGVNIFGDSTPLQSGKRLADVLNEIVERPVKEVDVHSKILCKKCYKTCTEYDSIQVRLKVIQTSMLSQFKKTLQSHSLSYHTESKEVVLKDVATCAEKKFEGKRIVLPASKLQPLPPDYLLRAGNWQPARPATLASKLNNQEIKILTPSTLNLKVTVGSSVLTQSIKTSSSLTGKTQRTTSHNSAPQTVSITSSSVMTAATTPSMTSSVMSAASTKMSNSVLSINVKDLQKNNLTSAILAKVLGRASDLEGFRQGSNDAGNEEQSMEIEEDCSLAVIAASEEDTKMFNETTTKLDVDGDKTQSDDYFDVSLLSCPDGGAEELEKKYILGKLEILDDDNDDEHTILMDGENGSIIRVVAGKKLLYGDNEISLMVPGDGDGDGDCENGDSQDSNDDTQIELQMSGDEETANAIIAAAQEQGGAFIKVESGEMFQVKSIHSKLESEAESKTDADVLQIVARVDGQYKCLICERNGEMKGTLYADAAGAAQHARAAHDARLHYCALCGELMRKKADYIAHLDKHNNKIHTDKSKSHECTICRKKYNSRQLLLEHMNVHSGERPYHCAVCGKTFASKYTHQSHLKTHLDRPRPFKCSQCGKSFLTQQNLTQHQKTHSGVKEFICKVCGKAFGTQHNLEVHGVVHSGSRPFVCGVCGKAFARRAEVRDHMRIHTGERPFSCEICGARFTQRSNLHSHRRATHLDDKRYKCQLCPKRFKRRRLLDYHVKASHTGERPLQCEVCRATFVYPEHYKKHVRIHSGEKPYVCEVCGRPFNTRDNLNTHRYVHSDKKPYECMVCGAGYMRKQLLYHHMNTTGHLAESIIVNQPRITKVPDVVTSSASLVLDQLDGNSTNLTDSIFDTTETLTMESTEKPVDGGADCSAAKLFITDDKKIIIEEGKSTINLVEGGEETPLITLHNIENVKDTSMLDAVSAEQLVNDAQQIANSAAEGAGLLRLVQVQLPDGRSGWLAVD